MFSVGVLYAAQEFLSLVEKNSYIDSSFPQIFPKISVASTSIVLKLCLEMGWIENRSTKHFEISQLGLHILLCKSPIDALRVQLGSMIKISRPEWLPLLTRGRSETAKYLPPSVYQCFFEAHLFSRTDEETIIWWDQFSFLSRQVKEEHQIAVGRKGERLSLIYEKKRTKKDPFWQSIESNLAGYDILSLTKIHSSEPLLIEVKTSTAVPDYAVFYLSRSEWDVAEITRNYLFHLWSLTPENHLYTVQVDEIKPHLPKDSGKGSWEIVKIPFRPFLSNLV